MSELNPLETQLRSWTPRRPSPGLKARLFGGRQRPRTEARLSLGWLAPVTACLLLLFVTFNQTGGGLAGVSATAGQGPIVAMTLSNVSLAAYLPGSFPYERNALPADTFEWTNTSRSPSSIASFPLSKTNDTKR